MSFRSAASARLLFASLRMGVVACSVICPFASSFVLAVRLSLPLLDCLERAEATFVLGASLLSSKGGMHFLLLASRVEDRVVTVVGRASLTFVDLAILLVFGDVEEDEDISLN